jgi:hypothetical protein
MAVEICHSIEAIGVADGFFWGLLLFRDGVHDLGGHGTAGQWDT